MDIKKEFARFPKGKTAHKYNWLIHRLFRGL